MADAFTFSLLDTAVIVRGATPDLVTRLAACYRAGARADVANRETLVVHVRVHAGGWLVDVPARPTATAPDLVSAVRALNHEVMHALMLRHPHLFFVHGGVVELGGRAVVLPGLSRAGKSTLVLALLCAGARLLSDELMVYDPRTRCLCPFARAVKVRDECLPYFPQFASAFVGAGEGRFLPFAAFPAGVVAERAELGLIVAPTWDGHGDDVLRPLSAGEGLLYLTRSALNFGSQRERSVDHLAALAGGSACFALTWRDPHVAAHAILAQLEA
jgi:hypothetical protein